MKKTIISLFLISSSLIAFSQLETIEFEKYEKCEYKIDIDYKDKEKNLEEAKKYKDKELILITANKKGKVKDFKRGFLETIEKDDFKSVYFEPTEHRNSGKKVAYFPIFNDKNMHCYDAKCFDDIKNEE